MLPVVLGSWGLCGAQSGKSSAEGAKAVASGGYRIDGIVVNAETGAPLPGAEVAIVVVPEGAAPAAPPSLPPQFRGRGGRRPRSLPTATQSVTTNESGVFDFENVAPGKYSLEASRRGFLTASYQQHGFYSTAIVTGPGMSSEGLTMKLSAGAVINGAVMDGSGDPIDQSVVSLYRLTDDGLGSIRMYRGGRTDETGAYEFSHLPPGTYYVTAAARVWYAAGDNRGSEGSGASASAAETRPTAEPAVNLDMVYPRTYYADATDSSGAAPITVHGGEKIRADLHMQAMPAVHINYATPAVQPGVEVVRFSQPTMLSQQVFGQNEPGVYQFSPVTSRFDQGQQHLSISVAPGEYEAEVAGRSVTVSAGGGDVQIDPAQGAAFVEVSGKLAAAPGTALPEQIYIALQGSDSRGPGAVSTSVGRDGEFHLERVRPGTYELEINAEGRQMGLVQMAVQGAQVDGHVLKIGTQAVMLAAIVAPAKVVVSGYARRATAQGDEAGSGVMIVLVPEHPGDHELYRRDQSDSDGSFSLGNVAAGKYTLVAIEDGWDLDWAEPGVIGRYLAGGQVVRVGGADGVIHLAKALVVQGR